MQFYLKDLSTLIIVAYNICKNLPIPIWWQLDTLEHVWYHELLDRGATITEDTIDDVDDNEIILDSCILAIFY